MIRFWNDLILQDGDKEAFCGLLSEERLGGRIFNQRRLNRIMYSKKFDIKKREEHG